MRILLLSKDNLWSRMAEDFLKIVFNESTIKVYKSNEKYKKIPPEILTEKGDILISFLSPWVVPDSLLKRFKLAINFHPGPPEYPGTGCYNFAIYEGSKEYGVTCHFMASKVDSGAIIRTIRFPIYPEDTPEKLQERSMIYLLRLFFEIIDDLFRGKELKPSGEQWKRKPFTKKDLDNLCKIDPKIMDDNEIRRRVKATIHSNTEYGPFIEIAGYKFYLHPEISKNVDQ